MSPWWLLVALAVLVLVAVLIYEVFIPLFRGMHCVHDNTRCIHGDEINQAGGRRQRCLDCGKALNEDAICTLTGKDIHEFHVGGDSEEDDPGFRFPWME